MKYLSLWVIFIVGCSSHLIFFMDLNEFYTVIVGLYILLPVSIQNLNEFNWVYTIALYVIAQIYPFYVMMSDDLLLKLTNIDRLKFFIVVFLHNILTGTTLAIRQKNNIDLLIERHIVKSTNREYSQILE